MAWLIVRRRFDRGDACVLLTIAAGLLVSFRYSHSSGLGRHYHIFAAVAGAWFVARAVPRQPSKGVWAAMIAAVLALAAFFAAEEGHWRRNVLAARMLPVARAVQESSARDDLIIVHGHEPTIDPSWNRRYNFEEPMVLYNARRRGWVLARDGVTLETLTGLHARGARLYVDQQPGQTPPDARRWLEQRAELVSSLPGGKIYRLPAR